MNVTCVKDDMKGKAHGLHPEWAVFRDMWRGFISAEHGKMNVLKINDDDDDLRVTSICDFHFFYSKAIMNESYN